MSITEADRALVEWTAQADGGPPLPEPWRDMMALAQHLIDIGVIEPIPHGTYIEQVAGLAQDGCRKWLESEREETA